MVRRYKKNSFGQKKRKKQNDNALPKCVKEKINNIRVGRNFFRLNPSSIAMLAGISEAVSHPRQ